VPDRPAARRARVRAAALPRHLAAAHHRRRHRRPSPGAEPACPTAPPLFLRVPRRSPAPDVSGASAPSVNACDTSVTFVQSNVRSLGPVPLRPRSAYRTNLSAVLANPPSCRRFDCAPACARPARAGRGALRLSRLTLPRGCAALASLDLAAKLDSKGVSTPREDTVRPGAADRLVERCAGPLVGLVALTGRHSAASADAQPSQETPPQALLRHASATRGASVGVRAPSGGRRPNVTVVSAMREGHEDGDGGVAVRGLPAGHSRVVARNVWLARVYTLCATCRRKFCRTFRSATNDFSRLYLVTAMFASSGWRAALSLRN
jgi:hypothetical protein